MNALVSHLTSASELLESAGLWDDLWARSDVTSPTLQAGLIAQWLGHFCPAGRRQSGTNTFHALIVEEQGRWLAALPLVEKRSVGVVRMGAWPANQWSDSGDLLLDPAVAPQPVLDALVQAMESLPWQALRLGDVPIATSRWQQTTAALERAALPYHFRPEMQPGRIDTRGDWESYQQTWSRRHRQQVTRHLRALSQCGRVEFQFHDRIAPTEVEARLSAGFDLEDQGWKGEEGSSVRRTAGMFAFYCGQACELARRKQLRLAMLLVNERPIAFAYGMAAKGTYRSYKVGYAPEFGQYSPGQLLRYHTIEHCFHNPDCLAIDYITPTPAHLHWRPERYQIGRLLIARPTVLGRCLVAAGRHFRRTAAMPPEPANP